MSGGGCVTGVGVEGISDWWKVCEWCGCGEGM